MAILFTIVFFILLIVASCKNWDVDAQELFCIGFVIGLIAIIILGILVINGRTLDAKIAMYTEENKNIETQMDTLVEQYMNYETGTYGELKGESSITLVSLYPELKADTLVAKQIDVYISNNEKIKELKTKLINISNYKWCLYFGG